jgi:hypothetical protein
MPGSVWTSGKRAARNQAKTGDITVTKPTATLYRITASYEDNGTLCSANTAEVLGEAYGRYYDTEEAATAKAEDMAGDIEDYDLDESTKYYVEEVAVEISDIGCEDDDGAVSVSATVRVDGHRYDTSWTARARNTTAGVSGLEPAGDSIDAWVDHDLAVALGDSVVAVGLEILAMAGR